MKLPILLVGAALAAVLSHGPPCEADSWDVLGLELPCRDQKRAAAFYRDVLGYELVRASDAGTILSLGEVFLVLDTTRDPAAAEPSSLVYLNHRIADLKAAALEVEEHGGRLLDTEPQAFVLGHSMSFLDPEGNRGNLVRLAAETEPAERLPQVFNLSIRAPGLPELERLFCEALGFDVYTRAYLPKTLPLTQRGTVMLVVHPSEGEGDEEKATGSHGCGAAILMAAPADASMGTPRSSPLFGEATVLSGPGGLEIVGVGLEAFERAFDAEDL